MYYSGVSGRGAGKILKMNKSNVMSWIKKSAKIDLKGQTDCRKTLFGELSEGPQPL